MKKKSCPFENEVLNSLASDGLKGEIKEHTASCPVCKESVSIYKWMNRFQGISMKADMAKKELPDAEFLWEKAFLVKRPDKELVKQALRPLIVPQVLAYVIAIIAPLYLFLNIDLDVSAVLTPLTAMLKGFFASFSFLLLPMTAGLISVIVFIFITGFEPKRPKSSGI